MQPFSFINNQTHRRLFGRRFWLIIHLYIGLTIGLIFVIAGITGSALVFYVEIDEFINPSLQIQQQDTTQNRQSYDVLLSALQKSHPERTGSWRLEMPHHSQAMITARYYKPQETAHLHFAPYMVSVNPYTAEVVSSRFWGQTLMTWIYDLHYTLLLDKTGKLIMAIIGGIFLLLLITGVYLWYPRTHKFKQAFTFKRRSSIERLIFDVHKLNGIYGVIFLLLLTLSGILLELPDVFNPIIQRISPIYKTPIVYSSLPDISAERISVDKAVNIAQQVYPVALLRWIETPSNEKGTYIIMLYQHGEPSERFPKTLVTIDQYSGRVLNKRNPMQSTNGDWFVRMLHPLHSGEIGGIVGRCLVFISGLLPLILYVTGFIRWKQKKKVNVK
jgi:uncharacterized iron-regulated membrane protein